MKSFYLLLAGTLMAISNVKADPNGIGNGGDPLRNTYQQAQTAAAQMVTEIRPCSFRSDVPASIREWILTNQAAYTQDILRTQQKWVVDLQGTCAYTAPVAGANVYLSYSECRDSTRSIEDAVFTLLHESVHHFGIQNEGFADAVARAVLYGTERVHSCPVAASEFDRDYCSGSQMTIDEALTRFVPGTLEAELNPSLQWSIRSRNCQTMTGCGAWQSNGATWGSLTLNSNGDYFVQPMARAASSLAIHNGNQLIVKLYTDTSSQGQMVGYVSYLFGDSLKFHNGSMSMQADPYRPYQTIHILSDSKLTNQCLWFKYHTKFDILGTGITREVDLVVYGNH